MGLKKVYKEGQMKKEGVKNVTITVENVKQGNIKLLLQHTMHI